MKPIEYLRALARRQRKSTDELLPGEQPTGIITYDGPLTEAEAEGLRIAFEERLTAAIETATWQPLEPGQTAAATVELHIDNSESRFAQGDSQPMRCPCVAIYSVCICSRANIRAQTKPSDFRAEQR